MEAYFFFLSDPGYTEFEEREQLYKINWTLPGFFSADWKRAATQPQQTVSFAATHR